MSPAGQKRQSGSARTMSDLRAIAGSRNNGSAARYIRGTAELSGCDNITAGRKVAPTTLKEPPTPRGTRQSLSDDNEGDCSRTFTLVPQPVRQQSELGWL